MGRAPAMMVPSGVACRALVHGVPYSLGQQKYLPVWLLYTWGTDAVYSLFSMAKQNWS